MSAPETVEAEVVESGLEVVPTPDQATNLFHTDDPSEVLQRAMSTANALMPVVREKGLIADISGKEHLTVEAWQTLGAMLGVTPVCVWTHKLNNGWEARVEARTLDGRVVGAAEAQCLTAESRWKNADDFAVRSMAQTRATSKSLASVLRFVATLGGAAGTPAEEMDGAESGAASEKQRDYVLGKGKRQGLIQKAKFAPDELAAIAEWAQVEGKLQRAQASKIIECLKDGTNEGRNELLSLAGFSDTPADESDLEQPGDPFEYEGDE
jgi:hypothetical protein